MEKMQMLWICAALAVGLIAVVCVGRFALRKKYSGIVCDAQTGEALCCVSVTDGRHVVKTGADGGFALRGYRRTRFIVVTVPPGYTAQAFYLPVSRKTKRYDFRLHKNETAAGATHSFLQISDTEVGADGVGAWGDFIRGLCARLHPAFLVHTGDICYTEGLRRHYPDMNTENMGLPVHYCIGNHDYVAPGYGEALFESIYGPVWYSFEVGQVHYVVTPFQTGADRRSGYSRFDRWRWLKNDLAHTDSDKQVILFNHNAPPSSGYALKFDGKTLDLHKHRLAAWVFGHYHYNYVRENNGVLEISTARPDCGGIDQSPSAARLVQIDASGAIQTKLYYYDCDKTRRAAPQTLVWQTELPGTGLFCDTLYADGRVYTATADDDWPRKCGVYCLDAETGALLWSYETDNSVKNNLVLFDGRLAAQDCAGNVYGLDAKTGELLWRKQVALGNSLNTSTGICTDGALLFTGCAAAITALNLKTGETVWETVRNKGECSAAAMLCAGDKLIVSSHWDALAALDKNTGKPCWKNRDGDLRYRSSTPAVLADGSLLVPSAKAVVLVDTATGAILHKTEYEKDSFSASGAPVIFGTTAYIPTASDGLVRFDLVEKTIEGAVPVGGALLGTPPYVGPGAQTVECTPLLLNESLFFGASDGFFYRVAADGSILGKVQLGVPVLSSAASDGKRIFVTDFSGRVVALSGV